MLGAPDLDWILHRELSRGRDARVHPAQRRLISILFATPSTATIAELQSSFAYFDSRSGQLWDLYVAGYYMPSGNGRKYDRSGFPIRMAGIHPTGWWFSPRQFHALAHDVAGHHEARVAEVPILRGRRKPWRYSGTPELVNFWATGIRPDWESLVARPLTDRAPDSLGNIVESHTDWASIPLRPGWRPGSRSRVAEELLHVDALRRALSWAVAGAAGAAVAEGVNVLIDALFRR
jgi:hypothetical protein